MPEMDGIEATKYIREVLKSKVPIIVVSAEFGSLLESAKSAGATEVVNKPCEKSTILKIVSQLF